MKTGQIKVVVWTAFPDVITMLRDLSAELNLKIIETKTREDFHTVKGHYYILDYEGEKSKGPFQTLVYHAVVDNIENLYKSNQKDIKGFFIIDKANNRKLRLEGDLKKIVYHIPLKTVDTKLPACLKKSIFKTGPDKREIFMKRLRRLIELYEMLDKENVKVMTFCNKHKISERTLRRDIEVLRLVYDAEISYKEGCWGIKYPKKHLNFKGHNF